MQGPEDRPELIEPALQKLKAFVATNQNRSLEWRVRQLMTLKRGLAENMERICEASEKDLNRNPFLSDTFNITPICLEIEDTIKALPTWMKDEVRDTPFVYGPGKSRVVHEPLGVCLIMPAWNFPFATCFNPLVTALAAGNVCLIKPSEMAPHSSKVIKEIIDKYFQEDQVACIEGGVKTSIAITQAKFDCIVFTGSPQKGKLVAAAAAKNLVPCILELGGKSPTIIDASANPRLAARKMVFTKFLNAGQICITTDYAMIHEAVFDDVIAHMKTAIAEFYGESPLGNQDIGKIINPFHTKRLASLLQEKHGGEVIIGGKVYQEENFIEPTVIVNPRKDSTLMKEEIFGPILPIFKFKEIDDVIEYIKAGEKPLAMYYFGKVTGNPNKERIINELSCGSMAVNEVIQQIMNPNLPFGGVGNSGYGRYHGIDGFRNLTNPKSVLVKPALDMKPFNDLVPPFNIQKQKQLKPMAKLLGLKTQSSIGKCLIYFMLVVVMLVLLATGFLGGFASRCATFSQLVQGAFMTAFFPQID